jgi:1-phosphofructokinase
MAMSVPAAPHGDTALARVVTVSLNSAIDQTLVIPRFTAGTVNRVQSSRMDPGGKGVNVAAFLADAGLSVTITGFLGGDNDLIFRRMFEERGIEDRCVRIAGGTRVGLKITDDVLRQTTDINFPGEPPTPDDLATLFGILTGLKETCEWFVLAGSIPPGISFGIYADLQRLLAGRQVLLDTSGEALRQALPACPALVKPNVDELAELIGKSLPTTQAVTAASRDLIARYGIKTVVVSMGKDGAVFVQGDEAFWAVPPEVQVKSTVGAGDAMVAGIVTGKVRGLALEECARLATAFSATAIGRVGHSLPSVAEVEITAERVEVRKLK